MKFILSLLLVAAIALMSNCNQQKSNTRFSYSMFRGDATHQSLSNSKEINNPPMLKWKFKTNGAVISSATILNSKIYFGSGDSCVYCLDEETGKQIWKFKTAGAVHSTPAVTNDLVYFESYDGIFYSLSSATGELKWKFKTDGEKCFSAPGIHGRTPKDSVFQDDWDFYLSSPAVDSVTVYFGTGSGYFYALDRITGEVKWKYKTNGVIHASPALAFGKVYFGSWDTYMYALDKNNGTVTWKFKTEIDTVIYNQTGMQGSPMIDDSILYFGCRDSHMYALNAITGKEIWKRFADYAWVSSTPVVFKSNLIYTTGDSHSLVSVGKTSGDSVFQTLAKGWIFSSPSVTGNQVYFGDINGILSCFDATTGKTIWNYQLTTSQKDECKILKADSTLNREGVFSKKKREEEHKTSMQMIFTLGAILSSPVISEQNIYFGSTDGNFYCLH